LQGFHRASAADIAARISIHPVDDGAVLLDRRDNRLLTLNPPSAFLWCCLVDEISFDEMVREYAEGFGRSMAEARADIDDALRAFRALNLLGETAADRAEPPPSQATVAVDRLRESSRPAAAGDRYRILDTVFDLVLPTRALRGAMAAVIGEFAVSDVGSGGVVPVSVGGEDLSIYVGGSAVERCSAESEAVPALKSALLVAAINRTRFAGCFHAAVLEAAGRAVLLPGVSGSGKTCLALALARRGLAYLSDETALLDASTLAVRGVPLPASVKSQAWRMMAALYPELARRAAYRRVDGNVVKYINPARSSAGTARRAERPRRVGGIVFPTYAADGATRIGPLSQLEAMARLFANCNAWAEPLTPAFVDRLTGWLATVPCYELVYRNLAEGADAVEDAVHRLA